MFLGWVPSRPLYGREGSFFLLLGVIKCCFLKLCFRIDCIDSVARIIAVDYGIKRVGLAVTDPLQIIASPLTTIATSELDYFFDSYFKTEEIEQMIVGYPLHPDGRPLELCRDIDRWLSRFRIKFPHIPVVKVDETNSSKEAVKAMIRAGIKKQKRRKKENIDKVSACIILQRYLRHEEDFL